MIGHPGSFLTRTTEVVTADIVKLLKARGVVDLQLSKHRQTGKLLRHVVWTACRQGYDRGFKEGNDYAFPKPKADMGKDDLS